MGALCSRRQWPIGWAQGGSFKFLPTDEESDGAEESHDPEWNSQVAAGKAMTILTNQARAVISVESASVYGAALVMPQLARSAGWSVQYTALAIRGHIGVICNVLIQGYFLYMVSKSQRLFNSYSGQMHLCDFGAHMSACADEAASASNCVGPGGTRYTAQRLYNWDMWSTRVYVRDALLSLFPEMAGTIHEKVDPGEYGMESHTLRAVCCFIFIVGLWGELQACVDIMEMLWYVPTRAESWITYEVVDAQTKDEIKRLRGGSELDFVKIRIAGMPWHWKVINLMFVWLPKTYLWILTANVGIIFLLETSTISDMIINAVALGFILNIDELLNTVLMNHVSEHLLRVMEDYCPFEDDSDSDQTCYESNEAGKHWNLFTFQLYRASIPLSILGPICMTVIFIFLYYHEHCERLEDGSWVSKPIRMPLDSNLSFLSFFFGPFPTLYPIATESDPIWEMPSS